MKKVALMGYYGFNNIGDEAIMKSIVSALSMQHDIQINIITSDINTTQKNLGEINGKNINLYLRSDIKKAIKNSDMLIFGGGSIFQDVTSSKSLYYYLYIIFLAKLYKKPVHIFANGFGPINKKINRIIFKIIAGKCSTISLRDKKSYNELIKLGLKKEKLSLAADSVFMLEPLANARAIEILKGEGIELSSTKKAIGISVRNVKNKGEAFAEAFAEICDKLIDECAFDLVFIPFYNKEDKIFSDKIINLMKNNDEVKILKKEYTPEEIMSVMQLMYINIGVRLHALIFSAKVGVPMIGINYDTKILGFLNSLGFKNVQKYDKINWSNTKAQVEKIFNNYSEIQSNLIKISQQNKTNVKENLMNIIR